MGRIILAIIAFAMAIAVLKMVIIAIIIAGLIFRPYQTLALLLIGGRITLTGKHPIIGIGLLILMIIGTVWNKKTADKPPLALPAPDPE